MADILTRVFRTFMSQVDLKKDLKVTPPSPNTCGTLLLGLNNNNNNNNISRSLLLLTAVTAAEEGRRVIFFTQTQIQSLPVSLQKCVPNLSPESLKKIKFCYPSRVEDLLQQVASLHESISAPPSLIIIDRLEKYLSCPEGGSTCGIHPGEQSSAAHLSALLCDTTAFLTHVLTQQSSSLSPCRFIASFHAEVDAGQAAGEASVTDSILEVLDRYFHVRCTLDSDRSYEATAAGLQGVWNIYLSGTGITQDSCTKDCKEGPKVDQEWQLLLFPDGLMEFKLL